MCHSLLAHHRTSSSPAFEEILKKYAQEAAIPIRHDLNEELAEVRRRLNSWWTFEITKRQLKSDEANIQEKLKQLDNYSYMQKE